MKHDRRQFLGAALAAAPMFVPTRAFGANDRLTFGLIGSGGRGRYLQQTFLKLGAQCAAICDVYDMNLANAAKNAPDAKQYIDYHELLAQPGLDAVVIATPDHQHAPMLSAALDAKKDVYLEKPMSHSIEESQRMIKAVRATRQIVQIGMQRRSAPAVIEAKHVVDSGILGRITMVKPMWNWNISRALDDTPLPGKLDWTRFLGGARKRELQPMRFRSWRYFWDYSGGNMTDQGTHLMDVVQWFTGHRLAKTAVCQGFVYGMKGAETPDCFNATFEYDNMMATWTLNYNNAYQNGWTIYLHGN